MFRGISVFFLFSMALGTSQFASAMCRPSLLAALGHASKKVGVGLVNGVDKTRKALSDHTLGIWPFAALGLVVAVPFYIIPNEIEKEEQTTKLVESFPIHSKPSNWNNRGVLFLSNPGQESKPLGLFYETLTQTFSPQTGHVALLVMHVLNRRGDWPFKISFEFPTSEGVEKGVFTIFDSLENKVGTGQYLNSEFVFHLNNFSGLSGEYSFEYRIDSQISRYRDYPSSSELSQSEDYKLLILTLERFRKSHSFF